MGRHYLCKACGRRLTVPEELFANKIRGRVVTVKCKGCGAPVGIDGTIPPPPVEAGEQQKKLAVDADETVVNRHRDLPSDETTSTEPASAPPASIAPSSEAPVSEAPVSEAPASKASASKASVSKASASKASASKASASKASASKASASGTAFRKANTSSAPAIETAAGDTSASKKPSRDDPVVSITTIYDPAIAAAIDMGDDPPEHLGTIDESWETVGEESRSDRFSHANGPITVRSPSARIGRYALFDQFAEGGVATVHFGRLDGAGGFSRVVAIKRLLPHLVKNPDFTEMLLNEARLAARVRHINVVPTLDVVAMQGDVFLVLEYVHGESLSVLCRTQAKVRKDYIPIKIAVAVMLDVLSGLCAVHEANDEKGRLLGLVHRDISPSNVIVGTDGYSRVLDFGIAKALENIEESMPSRLKGKIGYMAPEQIRGEGVTQQSDVFSAGIVLWELLAMRRLFPSGIEADRMRQIVSGDYPPPSKFRPGLSPELDQVTMKALAVDPNLRFARARDFAFALEHASARASDRRVAEWVADLAANALAGRARMIAQVEHWNIDPDLSLKPAPATAVAPVAASNPPPDIANARALLEEKLARVSISPSKAPPSLARNRSRNQGSLPAAWQWVCRSMVPFVVRAISNFVELIRKLLQSK
jgi:serine/threonine-protein kinase